MYDTIIITIARIFMAQGALGAAGVRRVWAGAGLQRAGHRGGAYRAASRTARCIMPTPKVGGDIITMLYNGFSKRTRHTMGASLYSEETWQIDFDEEDDKEVRVERVLFDRRTPSVAVAFPAILQWP